MADWEYIDSRVDLGALESSQEPVRVEADFRSDHRTLQLTIERNDAGDFTVQLPDGDGTREVTYIVGGIILVSNEGLTSPDLRDIPLARMVSTALLASVQLPAKLHSERFTSGVPTVPDDVKSQWPKGDRDEVFQWVKAVYHAALLRGLPPTKTVAEAFGVNRGTGSTLVQYARKAGVLTVSSANDPTKRKDNSNGNSGEVRD